MASLQRGALFARRRMSTAPCVLGTLHYQDRVPGKGVGRYIGVEDRGELCDVHKPVEAPILDARAMQPAPSLRTTGFELLRAPSSAGDLRDDATVESAYYDEVIALVKRATGATHALVFDHTVRETGRTNLNTLNAPGAAAAVVSRVHSDYTDEGAPRRLRQLVASGAFKGTISQAEIGRFLDGEPRAGHYFMFLNAWRNVDPSRPVLRSPLAVCDCRSVARSERFPYTMVYKDRVGENYSLEHAPHHRWAYFPRMAHDEVLLFKVFDSRPAVPGYVFHAAFEDPTTPPDAPPRASIECRTVAFFDGAEAGA